MLAGSQLVRFQGDLAVASGVVPARPPSTLATNTLSTVIFLRVFIYQPCTKRISTAHLAYAGVVHPVKEEIKKWGIDFDKAM